MAGATAVGCGPKPIERWSSGVHDLRDRIGGKDRSSVFIVPEGLIGLAPMVIGLHDSGAGPQAVYEGFGWRQECAKRGWLGVFPTYIKESQQEDNVYITHLAIRAVALGGGDPRRIYLVGHGAGGRRAYAMSCANPGWITAIAAASAVVRFREDDLGFQEPKAPAVSVIHLHGGKDGRVPVGGGPMDCGDRKTRHVLPLDEGLRPWIDQLGGKSAPMNLQLPAGMQGARWQGDRRDVVRVVDLERDHTWNPAWTPLAADFLASSPRRASMLAD